MRIRRSGTSSAGGGTAVCRLPARRTASSGRRWCLALGKFLTGLPVAGAWLSAILPLLFSVPSSVTLWQGLLPVPGLVLNLWALASLGTAFGISPARRGLVMEGPYRRIRHPMYAGELLSLIGGLLGAFQPWNVVVLLVFAVSLVWRITWEEKILNLNGYMAYAALVRWRLVPGIW